MSFWSFIEVQSWFYMLMKNYFHINMLMNEASLDSKTVTVVTHNFEFYSHLNWLMIRM